MEDNRDRRGSVGSFKSSSSGGDRRVSVSSFQSGSSGGSRRNSNAGSRKNSVGQLHRVSLSQQDQEKFDEKTEGILILGEKQSSIVESKFVRTGSVQYRNAGWKSSRMRNDSVSSTKSNASGKQALAVKEMQPNNSVPRLSPEEQKAHIHRKFIEIAAILKDSGVDEDILHKIRSTD